MSSCVLNLLEKGRNSLEQYTNVFAKCKQSGLIFESSLLLRLLFLLNRLTIIKVIHPNTTGVSAPIINKVLFEISNKTCLKNLNYYSSLDMIM